MLTEACEWNPAANAPAIMGGPVCPLPATVSVGANGQWHVCEACAKLPHFERLRKRTKIGSPP